MLVDLFGLKMQVDSFTAHLWSPWRGTQLEHKLFDAVKLVDGAEADDQLDEQRLHLHNQRSVKQALQSISRVLKGWQEEAADAGLERRRWNWLIEAEVDANGYDVHDDRACFWAFLRLSVERGGPIGEGEDEDIDLQGFGLSFWYDDES